MNDWKCPFCGSDKLKIATPFVKSKGTGQDYEKETTYCCLAQQKNHKFIEKNFDPDHEPDPDKISKWK